MGCQRENEGLANVIAYGKRLPVQYFTILFSYQKSLAPNPQESIRAVILAWGGSVFATLTKSNRQKKRGEFNTCRKYVSIDSICLIRGCAIVHEDGTRALWSRAVPFSALDTFLIEGTCSWKWSNNAHLHNGFATLSGFMKKLIKIGRCDRRTNESG